MSSSFASLVKFNLGTIRIMLRLDPPYFPPSSDPAAPEEDKRGDNGEILMCKTMRDSNLLKSLLKLSLPASSSSATATAGGVPQIDPLASSVACFARGCLDASICSSSENWRICSREISSVADAYYDAIVSVVSLGAAGGTSGCAEDGRRREAARVAIEEEAVSISQLLTTMTNVPVPFRSSSVSSSIVRYHDDAENMTTGMKAYRALHLLTAPPPRPPTTTSPIDMAVDSSSNRGAVADATPSPIRNYDVSIYAVNIICNMIEFAGEKMIAEGDAFETRFHARKSVVAQGAIAGGGFAAVQGSNDANDMMVCSPNPSSPNSFVVPSSALSRPSSSRSVCWLTTLYSSLMSSSLSSHMHDPSCDIEYTSEDESRLVYLGNLALLIAMTITASDQGNVKVEEFMGDVTREELHVCMRCWMGVMEERMGLVSAGLMEEVKRVMEEVRFKPIEC